MAASVPVTCTIHFGLGAATVYPDMLTAVATPLTSVYTNFIGTYNGTIREEVTLQVQFLCTTTIAGKIIFDDFSLVPHPT